MLVKPIPSGAAEVSNPIPSSATQRLTVLPCSATFTNAVVPPLCFTTLLSASCAMRNMHSSTGSGRRSTWQSMLSSIVR